MKLTVLLPAYNEAIFFEYTLKSLLPFVDEVIIVDVGMQAAVDAGYGKRSTDGTTDLIEKYLDDKKIFLAPIPTETPKTHRELMIPAFAMAKERNADWIFHVCADEIWPVNTLKPMKTILKNFEKNGILALNVWMYLFSPDFWHIQDFRNPRLAKVTDDVELISGDAVYYKNSGLYQYAGNTIEFHPPGTPEAVKKINGDYPKVLKAFHYSCVGKERVEFKAKFFQKFNNTYGDEYNEAFLKKDWDFFKKNFKEFTGKHPEIMMDHPLYNDRLF
ncbi:MAG: glycosyltransferase family A protein [Candidatus Hodarchaeales archaeon]|jgi:glycosyltransferase involved in cell wall biosynthesis